MRLIYAAFLHLYYFAIYILSLKNNKARLWIEGRRSIEEDRSLPLFKNCIWFHTSSLGEFEQIGYLIETMKAKFPDEKILVTFFSPSGYEIKKNYLFADKITYLPYDFKDSIAKFIETLEPKLVVWVRYEYWFNTLEELKKKEIPLILLNGVFRDKYSIFYTPYLKKCLRCFTQIMVINKSSHENLKKLGFSSTIIYDTRYSRMKQIAIAPFEDEVIKKFIKSYKVVVCGSIWPKDDDVLKATINKRTDIHWILVPHEVHSARINQLSVLFPASQKYSTYDNNKKSNILIIDSIGLLSRVYRFADLAYVGGGFNKVVHSLIEPMLYSLPIIVGKNIDKSEEAKEFLSLDFIKQISTIDEFERELDYLLTNDTTILRESKQNFILERTTSISQVINFLSIYVRNKKL